MKTECSKCAPFCISGDTKNRLITVTTTSGTTTFVYDGDGNRVKKTENGQTTVYVGALFEKNLTTNVATSYYLANGQPVALRQNTTVSYLHGDHLGSTSLTTDTSGNVVSRQMYLPYGKVRYVTGTLPTDKGFTGQRFGTGLMYYGARYYSMTIGKFISADTIVPGAGNPQTLNRFSYTLNNPLKYVDPTGHCVVGGHQMADSSPACASTGNNPGGTAGGGGEPCPILSCATWNLIGYAITAPKEKVFTTYTLGFPSGGIGRYVSMGSVSIAVDWEAGDVGFFSSSANAPRNMLSVFPPQYTGVSLSRGLAFGSEDASLDDFKGEGSILGISVGPSAFGISGEFSASPSHNLHGVSAGIGIWTGTFPMVDKAFTALAGEKLPDLHMSGVSVAGYTYNTETVGVQFHVGTVPLAIGATAMSVVMPGEGVLAWHALVASTLNH